MSSDYFTANLFTDDTEESVLVEFDIEEGQKLILYPNDQAQEGIEPSIQLTSVKIDKLEVISLLSIPQYEDIVEQAWKYLDERSEERFHGKFNRHW